MENNNFDFGFGFDPVEADLKEEGQSVQQNVKLFKFILTATKCEITYKRFVNLVYSSAIAEMCLWILGFAFFVTHPGDYWYIWILGLHLVRSIAGTVLTSRLPRTHAIIEKINNMENLKEEDTLDTVEKEVKTTFEESSKDLRILFKLYFTITGFNAVVDLILQIDFLFSFGDREHLIREVVMLFILTGFNCSLLNSLKHGVLLLVRHS